MTTVRDLLKRIEESAPEDHGDVPPGFEEVPVSVKVKRVRYADNVAGLAFQVGHAGDKVYDAYLKDRIASWSPGIEKSIAVLRRARYSDEEIQELFDAARADDSFRGIELPRPVTARFTVLRRKG